MNESTIELAALEWFGEIGFAIAHGPDLAPDGKAQERESFVDVMLVGRLRDAIARLNPDVPSDGLEEALRKSFGRQFQCSLVLQTSCRRNTSLLATCFTQPAPTTPTPTPLG